MKQIWGIGKRRFKKDWKRMWPFYTLVWPVIGCGAEKWGWREREEIERLQATYIRWTLGVDRKTLGYMAREEAQRDKLGTRAGKRAWKFE